MIRFLCFIFNKPYETCKSCQTLKEQLAYERDEKRQLTETLLRIVSPKIEVQQEIREIEPVIQTSGLFSRRRAALEARDREEAKILKTSTNLGKPDDKLKEIEKLETELGIEEKEA
jgi:tRNA/tmRNA/rRNA uracil-C5-methylase (TrmA/RlmC/RlmD family)